MKYLTVLFFSSTMVLSASITPTNSKRNSIVSRTDDSIDPYTSGLTGVNLGMNNIATEGLWTSVGIVAAVVILLRVIQLTAEHFRLVTTLNLTDKQLGYWTRDSPTWSKMKKHMLYAPIGKIRHNRELQLSKATNFGTLPLRFHVLLLILYLASNIAYTLLLNYKQPLAALLAEMRGRTGHLAVINIMVLFIIAARNNPFIPILGVSFDTFNLFHRWIGRIVVLESVAHVICWGINKVHAAGWEGMRVEFATDSFGQHGLLAMAAFLAIFIQSLSPVRHAFYETFIHLHQLLAGAAIAGVFIHVQLGALPQMIMMWVIVTVWFSDRIVRFSRIIYYNVSHRGITDVHVEALDGGACRATFSIPSSWTADPGVHIYAYIPAVSLWMSHPFSVAWAERGAARQLSPNADGHNTVQHQPPPIPQHGDLDIIASTQISPAGLNSPSSKSLDFNCNTLVTASSASSATNVDLEPVAPRSATHTSLTCVMAARTGMTRTLYNRARKAGGTLRLRAFVEGPYGGLESLRSYATVLLFAGGVGITHQLSHLRDLVQGMDAAQCATRKVVLVWSVRSTAQIEWVRSLLDEVLAMPRGGREVRVIVYVTRGMTQEEGKVAPLADVEVRSGRPDVGALVEGIFADRVGAMTVGVCGPGALADDVRAASRGVVGAGKINFREEAFTW